MTIVFPDVSEYTPNVDPAQYPALIARATLSTSYVDPTYTSFKAKAAAAGTVFAAYHWLNHGNLLAQAKHCLDVVGPVTPVMIDAEDMSGNTGYNGPLAVTDIVGFAYWCRQLGGICNLVYLPRWYWSGPMAAPDLRPLAGAGLHLVSSYYTAYSDTGPGWEPYGGLSPVQWQYTSTPIDMNAFRGTAAEYAALIGGTMTSPVQARQLANADQYWYDVLTEEDPLVNIYAAQDGTPVPLPNLPLQRMKRIEAKVDALAAAVAALSAPPAVDTAALASELVTKLEMDGIVTQDGVRTAIKAVLDAKLAAAQTA